MENQSCCILKPDFETFWELFKNLDILSCVYYVPLLINVLTFVVSKFSFKSFLFWFGIYYTKPESDCPCKEY